MYTKSLFASALLATSVAATSHEVWVAAPQPAPAAHVAPPMVQAPPPAAHVTPPVANVHQQQPPMAPPMHTTPAAAPPVAAMPPPTKNVMGGEHQQLTVHLVAVGDNNGSLKYFPDSVHAMPGDVVQFQFHPKVRELPLPSCRKCADNPRTTP